MADNRNSKFGVGLVLGALIGGLGAFLLSPKNGEENRKLLAKKIKELQKKLGDKELQDKVNEIFGDATDQSMKLYKSAKKDLAVKLEDIKGKVEDFDQDKYIDVVNSVIDDVQGQVKASSKHIESLKKYLLQSWNTLAQIDGEEAVEAKPEKKKAKRKS